MKHFQPLQPLTIIFCKVSQNSFKTKKEKKSLKLFNTKVYFGHAWVNRRNMKGPQVINSCSEWVDNYIDAKL